MRTKIAEEMIPVVVVDDHALIREGVAGMIAKRTDVVVVGEGDCGDDVFDLAEKHHPKVLILDLRMPQHQDRARTERFDILSALARLQKEYPETAVIILSQHVSYTFVQAAIEHGVRSYLLKDDDLSLNIIEAIDAVLAGNTFFSREVNNVFYNGTPQTGSGIKLNKRQLEIVNWLVRNPEKQIAELAADLCIAPSTMKGHLNKIFAIFDVPNRPALVIRALQMGIVPFHVDSQGRVVFD